MNRGYKEDLFKYNDYELLYMIGQDVEEAMDIMLSKYQFLIRKMIYRFHIPTSSYEDYMQEGLLMIHKAIRIYDENSTMSFTRYVEMLIYHRYIDLMRKGEFKKEQLVADEDLDYITYHESPYQLEERVTIAYEEFSELEKKVYELRFLQELPSKQISQKLNLPIDTVYSATERIRRKVRRNGK